MLTVTLIIQWERNSKTRQGLNIAHQAMAEMLPGIYILKSRGWHAPRGTARCFNIRPARLSPMGPWSLLETQRKHEMIFCKSLSMRGGAANARFESKTFLVQAPQDSGELVR